MAVVAPIASPSVLYFTNIIVIIFNRSNGKVGRESRRRPLLHPVTPPSALYFTNVMVINFNRSNGKVGRECMRRLGNGRRPYLYSLIYYYFHI